MLAAHATFEFASFGSLHIPRTLGASTPRKLCVSRRTSALRNYAVLFLSFMVVFGEYPAGRRAEGNADTRPFLRVLLG
jgi:hypothetical protein